MLRRVPGAKENARSAHSASGVIGPVVAAISDRAKRFKTATRMAAAGWTMILRMPAIVQGCGKFSSLRPVQPSIELPFSPHPLLLTAVTPRRPFSSLLGLACLLAFAPPARAAFPASDSENRDGAGRPAVKWNYPDGAKVPGLEHRSLTSPPMGQEMGFRVWAAAIVSRRPGVAGWLEIGCYSMDHPNSFIEDPQPMSQKSLLTLSRATCHHWGLGGTRWRHAGGRLDDGVVGGRDGVLWSHSGADVHIRGSKTPTCASILLPAR